MKILNALINLLVVFCIVILGIKLSSKLGPSADESDYLSTSCENPSAAFARCLEDENDRPWISRENSNPSDRNVYEIIVQDGSILVFENPGDRPIAIINDACSAGVINEKK